MFLGDALAVTTVSKTEEDSFKSAAAVYIINRDDIKRSGAVNIAEILRTVPGLQVAQGESGQWMVTSRGFANGFANKLLVMVDGRSIYTPLFSGVHWGLQDVMLENIKQIEIVRGPGATQWGANAVNGVINIITEPALNTQSALVTALQGNDISTLNARYGGKIKDNSYYRLYVSNHNERDVKSFDNRSVNNNSEITRSGFRVDYDEFEKDFLTLQGDIYDGDDGLDLTLPDLAGDQKLQTNLDVYGGNIMGKWDRKIDDDQDLKMQVYYDKAVRNFSLLSRRTQIIDLDLQYSKSFKKYHTLTSGVGYRGAETNLKGNSFRINFNPAKRYTNLYSAFIQDQISLFEDKFLLTIGSKFEHNDFTGYEVQPSIRSSWLIDSDQTLWASISRATRRPNISENDIKMVVGTVSQFNSYSRQQGDGGFSSEDLMAYELGYRVRPTNDSSIDIATFYNDYDNLRTAERTNPFSTNENGNNFLSVFPQNNGQGKAFGIEINGDLKVNKKWQLKAGYSYLKLDLDANEGSDDSELEKEQRRSPMHQFNIQSRFNITDNITFDNTLYYVDTITVSDHQSNSLKIPSYYRLDTHIGWKYSKNLSFDLVGQNLFDDYHTEFSGALWSKPIQVGRTIYIKAALSF
ncbi:MAG: TonB-dependent receptor [Proteobacteria bacterium]|nr:TonB-dependent receptor [Pseudomonadota bacterium]